jgi:hypothetical protein
MHAAEAASELLQVWRANFLDVYPEQQHIDVVDIARRTSTAYK